MRRWFSLDLKFPALMTGIVLCTSAVFLWLARNQFSGVLLDASGARLLSSATLIAGLIEDGVPAFRTQVGTLANLDAVRHRLAGDEDSTFLAAAIRDVAPQTGDSAAVQVRLLGPRGEPRQTVRLRDAAVADGWAEGAATRGELSTVRVSISPILAVGDRTQFEVVVPIHARDDGESHVGYLVQTRAVRGRGVEAVRQLIGTSTMLFGQPGAGAWSDLEHAVPGPPPFTELGSPLVFDESPRGPGVGVARAIRGTPWVIWLQISKEQALTPVNAFLWRMAPVVLLVAALGALLAWWFSRRITSRIVRLTADVDQVANAGRARAAPPRDSEDEIDRLQHSFELMSERAKTQHQLEAQLLQSQKLEAVGRLAGGIAHDFNNVLTVVTNFSEIIKGDLPPDSPAAGDLDQILQAATRASGLTRQLLAFSRRQILQPVQLDLNDVVRGSHRMLERLIPSHVAIVLELDSEISAVLADPLQIEQVLLNLAVNASDAMPDGGRLTFRTSMTALDAIEPDASHELHQHVCLMVKDSGIGMDRETTARIFEPFFTTKDIGKGTGLGLATVHGIITQLGGRVWVYSEPGKGTTFKLYLPAIEGDAMPFPARRDPLPMPRGKGTILLVEDDPGTRAVTTRLLTRQGYTVVEATTADEALARLDRDGPSMSLILTDVMMPGMNGVEFARHVRTRWPGLPLLLMSGYSDAEIVDGTDAARLPFVEKPFTSSSLLTAVAQAMVVAD